MNPCKQGHDEGRNKRGACKTCVRATAKAWWAANPEKSRAYSKTWRQANPEKRREQMRKSTRKRNGLPLPTRLTPELCENCGSPPGRKALSLDHDHTTGAFRGWLCLNCNVGIGKLGDSIAGLMRAVSYLKRNEGDE